MMGDAAFVDALPITHYPKDPGRREPTMCGRYVLDDDGNIIAYIYAVPKSRTTDISRRFNIAPTQKVPNRLLRNN